MEPGNIGRAWPFQIAICFIVMCIIPLNCWPITKILKEIERWRRPLDLVLAYSGNFTVPWNAEKWPSMAILNTELLHGTVHHATFQTNSWNHSIIRAVTSSPRPGPRLTWKISNSRGTRKNWPSIAILNSDQFHGTVHHPTKFQADTWNP